MPKVKLSQEEKQKKIYENSLHTCIYVSGRCQKGETIRVKCLIHNIEFSIKYDCIRKSTQKRFICPECKRLKRSETIKTNCDYCGKEYIIRNSRLKKSLYHFCCRECKDNAQRISSGSKFNQMRPQHYGKENSIRYRKLAFATYSHACATCGWCEDEDILEVHHIDSNRLNNDISNLIILCPNCHGKLTSNKYELIDRHEIVKKGS